MSKTFKVMTIHDESSKQEHFLGHAPIDSSLSVHSDFRQVGIHSSGDNISFSALNCCKMFQVHCHDF